MNFNDYQDKAIARAIYPREYAVVYPALGLCGEAGEVAEKIKKIIRDAGADFDTDSIRKREILGEIGDVLWYMANLAHDLGFTLDEIAEANLVKLDDRHARNVIHGSGDNR